MVKLRKGEILGLIPSVGTILILFSIWVSTGFNREVFKVIYIAIPALVYALTHILAMFFFEIGESKMKDDNELIKLQKEDSAMLWGFLTSTGFAFFFGGLASPNNVSLLVSGIVILSIGNILYYSYYFPRYRSLVRQRLNYIELSKQKHTTLISEKNTITIEKAISNSKKKWNNSQPRS